MELTSSIQYENQFISNKTVTFVETNVTTKASIESREKFDIGKIFLRHA